MRDGRGEHNVRVATKNKQAIIKFIENYPNSTKLEVCMSVGITYATLRKHLKVIDKECEVNQ